MSTTKPVALILGAGPNIGTALTHSLSALDYRIALASRSGTNTLHPNGTLSLSVDLTSPSSIPSLFTTITEKFGTPPSIVIYNAAALTPPPDTDSVLSVPVEQFSQDLMVNTVAPYVAAMEAVKAWEGMGEEGGKKTFVYTGNALNGMVMPVALMLTLGVGKSASAHWVGLADALYKARGYR
jgi:NAD(P)-dependent dehydrogenase (short-subunit alcohol dehydrogenase family)